jgi:hypothetical protein
MTCMVITQLTKSIALFIYIYIYIYIYIEVSKDKNLGSMSFRYDTDPLKGN